MSIDQNPSYDPEYQIPCTAAFEFVTPEMAKHMLGRGNRKNRKLDSGAVARLHGVMDRDEWMYDSTDAIGTDTDGVVVNGQHRLVTISEGSRGVWCLVVRGVRSEIINVVDQGKARSFTQTLWLDGSYTDPNGVSQAVDWAFRMIGGHEKSQPAASKPSVPQLLNWLSAHPQIADSLTPAKLCHQRVPVKVGMLAAYHYAFSCVDAQLADDFLEQLETGLEVEPDHPAYNPAYTLRERLIKELTVPTEKQLKPWQIATFLVQAWEAARAGKKLPQRQFAKAPQAGASVPTVSDVDWLGTREENTDQDADDKA
jgi:hypothetical protein